MKTFPSLLILALVLTAPSVGAQDDAPAVTVRDFYAWYVKIVAENKDPVADNRQEMRRFVTGRLIREIEGKKEKGADYFLNAQDVDKEWEKNVAVDNSVVNDNRATLDVTLKGQQLGEKKLKVSLIKKRKAWKIDQVEGR